MSKLFDNTITNNNAEGRFSMKGGESEMDFD